MNNRDPFNLRNNSISALTVLRTNTASLRESLAEGSEALSHGLSSAAQTVAGSMSSYAPPSVASQQFGNDHWQSAGRSKDSWQTNGGLAEKVGGFFGADRHDTLPMYKDKPYGHLEGGKWRPWYKRRKTIGLALLILLGLTWWLELLPFSSTSSTGSGSKIKSSTQSKAGRKGKANWAERAQQVKETFKISFAGYEKHAWGYDEYSPVSKHRKQMTPKGMGWIIVDALDTMMIMNLTSELTHAREWIHNNLTYDQDHDVNTFETTIRMLGGLLSAHYLSTGFDGVYAPVDDNFGEDMYLEKAADLADRLLGAYDTGSGVPFASINLHTKQGIPSHDDGGASSTAEATTLQLEMKYLAFLTGETYYWKKAEHVMQVVDNNNAADGLVPIFIYADRGTFRGQNIRLGSRGDSYYEYLIKQYLQTSRQEPIYQEMWNETLAGVKKNLITYSSPSNFTVLAERPSGIERDLSPKMDHLVCFMPGTIALATTNGLTLADAKAQPSWGAQQEEDMRLAEELAKTCWGMYKVTPAGLAGEISHFNLHDPPLMYNEFPADSKPRSPDFEDVDNKIGVDDYIIKTSDSHNLQRPETAESLFYMWRITGDQKYRDWGWEMYENFVRWMAVEDGEGFSSLRNVMVTPPPMRDNMESFWLAETLKYLFLLFSPNDILPLTEVVFNTEAHPFPHFTLGKLFTTGWERIPRDKNGNLIPQEKPRDAQSPHIRLPPTVETVEVVHTDKEDSSSVAKLPTEGGKGGVTDVQPVADPEDEEPPEDL